MVYDREEKADSDSLAEGPFRVLPTVTMEVFHNEEGKTREFESEGCQSIYTFERLICKESHCVGGFTNRTDFQ